MIPFRFQVLLLNLLVILASCSSLKKEDPEKQVRDFLATFQGNLGGDEKKILEFFDTPQSKESLLSAISVIQNKETELIVCEVLFSSPSIIFRENGVEVSFPVKFNSQKTESQINEESKLVLQLKAKNNSYVISLFDAEELYKTFAKMKNEMQWDVQREKAFKDRKKFYDIAGNLEQKFDSVIWFTTYKDEPYFYVVSGTWDNYFRRYEKKQSDANVVMGVVNKEGSFIVPMEFDLVETLGFNFTGIVEVKKDNKFGYYDFESQKQIVPVEYDLIIPYGKQNVLCIVKKDQAYGYYTFFHQYQDGFPSDEVKQWVESFLFIPEHLQLKAGIQSLCEIPAKEHAGFGIIIPPSYLVKTGIFDEFIGGITSTEFPLEGWTDYLETEGTVTQRISESLMVLVTTIKERYLEGREEFYTYDKLVLMGPQADTLAVENLSTSGAVSIRKIDSLIEVKYQRPEEYYFEQSIWPDVVPSYSYFKVSKDSNIYLLKSRREFPQTEFVKLDSTYFKGKFSHSKIEMVNGEEVWQTEQIDFVSKPTIQYMRDEILASYGVRVENKDNDNFEIFKEVPEQTREDAEKSFTEIDHHNILFLESLLSEELPKNI